MRVPPCAAHVCSWNRGLRVDDFIFALPSPAFLLSSFLSLYYLYIINCTLSSPRDHPHLATPPSSITPSTATVPSPSSSASTTAPHPPLERASESVTRAHAEPHIVPPPLERGAT